MDLKKWLIPFALFAAAAVMGVHVLAQHSELPLVDKTIVLDSGHGGEDDGAQREGIKEDEINLKITKQLSTLLSAQGANVILTREGDYDLAQENAQNRKREDMKRRVELINCGLCDYYISIHLNAYPASDVKGAQVFFQKDQPESEKIAVQIQKQLNKVSENEKNIKAGDYYILNKPSVPGVLVECGFLSNPQERNRLNEESYQKTLAKAILEGLLIYEKENK